MKITVTAIEPFNSHKPGEVFELTEREATHAELKGLVKKLAPFSNKMKAEPENKANPSPADGGEVRSFASPAAQVSPQTTVKPSGTGRPRGRPRKSSL